MNAIIDSRFRTLVVPAWPSQAPATLCETLPVYTHVLVRNLNAAAEGFSGQIWLAYDDVEITGGKVGLEKLIIPPGERDVVLVAPNQKLYAVSITSANGSISMMRSLALSAYPQLG